jgi:predicted Zn-dependent peptidase
VGSEFLEFDLGIGGRLYVNPTGKFKTISIRVLMQQRLRPVAVSLGALVPRVLKRGSREYPTMRSLATRLEELYGSRMTIEATKIGDRQVTMFGLDVPAPSIVGEDNALLEQAVRLLSGVITSPALSGGVFDERLVEQEKGAQERHIRSIVNDRTQYALLRCVESMFEGEPFGLSAMGRVEEVRAITPSALHEHYAGLVSKAPVHVFVVGPVDPGATRETLETNLNLPEREAGSITSCLAQPLDREPRQVEERLPLEQAKLVMGFRTHTGLASRGILPVMVFEGILGGYPHSKLFSNVRERRGLCYFIQSVLDNSKGLLFIIAGTGPDETREVQEVALDQVDAIRRGEFSDFEFDATKRALSHRIRSSADSPLSQTAVHYEYLLAGKDTSLADRLDKLASVTRDHVAEAAARVQLDTVYTLSCGGTGSDS